MLSFCKMNDKHTVANLDILLCRLEKKKMEIQSVCKYKVLIVSQLHPAIARVLIPFICLSSSSFINKYSSDIFPCDSFFSLAFTIPGLLFFYNSCSPLIICSSMRAKAFLNQHHVLIYSVIWLPNYKEYIFFSFTTYGMRVLHVIMSLRKIIGLIAV